ncbi:amidase family protein [Streptomyces sp. NPDC056227]|uniref:amidase family protein n=1 Tax=Streptomyces sp. NPDC056227 TaxID=3345753 RepID=UPI0035E2BC7B
MRQLGAETREFALPEFPGLSVVNGLTMLAEAFAAHGDRLTADWTGHGRAFRRLAAAGGLVPAHRYLRAQQLRTRLTSALRTRMSDAGIDLIATPTWPAPARPYTDEALPGAELNLTAAWNPTGFPALALPMGFESGLPLSLQLVGRPWSEPALLTAGAAYQSATTWHLRRATPDPACTPSPRPGPGPGVAPRPAHSRGHASTDLRFQPRRARSRRPRRARHRPRTSGPRHYHGDQPGPAQRGVPAKLGPATVPNQCA